MYVFLINHYNNHISNGYHGHKYDQKKLYFLKDYNFDNGLSF